MLHPEQMHKVRVTCHRAHLPRVVEELYGAKALHLVQHVKSEELNLAAPLAQHEAVSRVLVAIGTAKSVLAIDGRGVKPLPFKDVAVVERKVLFITQKANELLVKQKELDARLATLRQERTAVAIAKTFAIGEDELRGSERLACLFGTVKTIERLDEKLAEITSKYHLQTRPMGGTVAVFLAIDAAFRPQALTLLSAHGFSELILSSTKDVAGRLKRLGKALAAAEDHRQETLRSFRQLTIECEDYLLGIECALLTLAEKTGAPLGFGATETTVIITGWVPQTSFMPLRRCLDAVTNGRHDFEELKADEDEAGPVKLRNPLVAKPFQTLLDLYSLPNSHEIDPTLFLWITFPLFFGFMLGDIGYGFVTLILFLFLKRKLPAAKDLLNVMTWTSLWTIAFGLVYGEFFGFEELWHHELPHLLSRTHEMPLLITVSLLIGVAHLLLGLLLGFANVWRHQGFSHAVKEKVGWMLLLPFLTKVLIILGLIEGAIGEALTAALPWLVVSLLAGLGVLLVIVGEGIRGAIELPGIFSNILSYSRLMALGLAGVSLAIVINQFAEEFAAEGGSMLIAAVLVFTVGHAINILLGIIGPFLHSLRLHYVEQFGKFYQGGGEEYRPFGATEDEA